MTTKICSKCNRSNELSDFHRSVTSRDGRSSRCKSCRAEDARRYLDRRRQAEREAEERAAALAGEGIDVGA